MQSDQAIPPTPTCHTHVSYQPTGTKLIAFTCLLQDCQLLPEVTGYAFPQLRVTLQYLCALHTTLSQALDNGKPYAVTVKYCSPVVQGVARVAPLLQGNDSRLAA